METSFVMQSTENFQKFCGFIPCNKSRTFLNFLSTLDFITSDVVNYSMCILQNVKEYRLSITKQELSSLRSSHQQKKYLSHVHILDKGEVINHRRTFRFKVLFTRAEVQLHRDYSDLF